MTRTPAGPVLEAGRFVGVDVVDLTAPRTMERASDARFLQRVFSPEERERIRVSPAPDRVLWTIWAAKEAAFKVISKMAGSPPVFRHADFRVAGPPDAPIRHVRCGSAEVEVGMDSDDRRILVWAWNGSSPEILVARSSVEDALALLGLDRDRERWEESALHPEERDAVHSLASALVRIMARRDAAHVLGVPRERLAIVCPPGDPGRRPPFLHQGGKPAPEVDLSLSHDGDELAWAIRRWELPRG